MTPVLGLESECVLQNYKSLFNFQEIARLLACKQAEVRKDGEVGDYILDVMRNGVPSKVIYVNVGPNKYHAHADLTADEIIPLPRDIPAESTSLDDSVDRELEKHFGSLAPAFSR